MVTLEEAALRWQQRISASRDNYRFGFAAVDSFDKYVESMARFLRVDPALVVNSRPVVEFNLAQRRSAELADRFIEEVSKPETALKWAQGMQDAFTTPVPESQKIRPVQIRRFQQQLEEL